MSANTTYTAQRKKFPYDFHIVPEALIKLNEYARAAVVGSSSSEIGGIARLEMDKENCNIFILDVEMLPQSSSAAYFELDENALNEWMRRMIKEGRGEEISEWKSIVHSHPVGMGPTMSGTDVEEIKKFAQEGEAFSLIISASRTADSKNMKMHYCCNIHGEKHVIEDLPVAVALSTPRLALAQKLNAALLEEMDASNFNDKDRGLLTDMCRKFCSEMLPTMWDEERTILRQNIEEHVKQLIKPRTLQNAAVIRSQAKGTTHTKESVQKSVETAKERHQKQMEKRINDAVRESQSLSDDEQDYLGHANYDVTFTKHERELMYIEELFSIGFEQIDPQDLSKVVSNKRAKKARKLWQNRISILNNDIRQECGVGLYDWVVVDYERMKTKPEVIDTDLANTPHEITGFTDNHGTYAFEVANETFWAHELKLVKTFEKHREEERIAIMNESKELNEQERIEEQRALAAAADEMENEINSRENMVSEGAVTTA